jgi:hypothetical protein
MFFKTDYSNCDQVSFYIRDDFSNYFDKSNDIFDYKEILTMFDDDEDDENKSVTHIIRRGDDNSLRYYIKKYMDTNVKKRRPDTPAKLIINRPPKEFIPKL